MGITHFENGDFECSCASTYIESEKAQMNR